MDKDIEKLKELSKCYKSLAEIIDKVIALEDAEELTDKEIDEKVEELLGNFLIKTIKAKKLLEGLK